MIMPLLIARKENAGILRSIYKELEILSPRELIGSDWSLKLFLQSDMKNYTLQTHFILDVSAFKESGNEFIELLEGITLRNEKAKLIIFADTYYAGDDFLDSLVKKSYTNIVAHFDTSDEQTNYNLMFDSLKECFSPNGLSAKKYRRFDKSYNERSLSDTKKELQALPSYENADFTVGVIGAMERIGTTSYALHLCDYITRRAVKAALVMFGESGNEQRGQIKELFNATDNGDYITINGIDIYSNALPSQEYNAVIFDFGNIDALKGNYSILESASLIVLCGGTGWNELPKTVAAQKLLNGVNYTLAINMSTDTECERYSEKLQINLNDYVIMPYSPAPFNAKDCDAVFDKLYSTYQIAEPKENEDEYEA